MIGEQIRTLRLARGLSQVELAEKLSCSKQTVSNWENNNIMPSVEVLKKIAIFFGCTTDYLLELDGCRTMIEITNLSPEQSAHIQQVIRDLEYLNQMNQLQKDS